MKDVGDELAKLLDEVGPRVFALIVRITWSEDAAADLLQDLFVKMAQSPAYRSARDPTGYLYRSAIHSAFDWRRKQKRLRQVPFPTRCADREPLANLIAAEEIQEILRALERLSPSTRDAVVLRHLQEQSFEEIGRRLEKTSHQARALCHKGLAQLRQVLQKTPTS